MDRRTLVTTSGGLSACAAVCFLFSLGSFTAAFRVFRSDMKETP